MCTIIENVFASYHNLFKMFATGKKIKLIEKKGTVVHMVVSAFLLHNCYTCLNGANATTIFQLMPLTLEEYLPVDEELELAPIVDFVFEQME